MSQWRRKKDGRPYADLRDRGLGRVSILTDSIKAQYGHAPPDSVCQELFDSYLKSLGTVQFKEQGWTIARLIEWYCDVYHAASCQATKVNRRSALNRWLAWCEKQDLQNPARFDNAAAHSFVAFELHDIKPNGLKTYLAHVKGLFNAALKIGLISTIPVTEWPKLPRSKPEIAVLSPAEIGDILDAVQRFRRPYYPVVLFLAATGWRVGDVVGLRVADVDMVSGRARRRSAKTGQPLRLNKTALEALEMGVAGQGRAFTVKGRPVSRNLLGYALRSACKAAGIEGPNNPHVFRHSMAVRMAEAGVPLAVISEALGHANKATTLALYQNFLPGASESYLETYGAEIQGATAKRHPNVTPFKKSS